jgi:hypothetical protein
MNIFIVVLIEIGKYKKEIEVKYNTRIGFILQKNKINPELRPLLNGKEVTGDYRVRKNCTFVLSKMFYGGVI